MAKIKTVQGTIDDVILATAKNLARIVMTEAKLHIDKEGYKSIDCLTDEGVKRCAVLGRALTAFAEEFTKDDIDNPICKILVSETMDDVLAKCKDVDASDLNINEDDVDEEYVTNPNHIDPMFG